MCLSLLPLGEGEDEGWKGKAKELFLALLLPAEILHRAGDFFSASQGWQAHHSVRSLYVLRVILSRKIVLHVFLKVREVSPKDLH